MEKARKSEPEPIPPYVRHGSGTDENGFRHTGSQVVGHQTPKSTPDCLNCRGFLLPDLSPAAVWHYGCSQVVNVYKRQNVKEYTQI